MTSFDASLSLQADVEPLDVARVRQDFPALHQTVHGHPLVYLDNAATTQKPQAVIDRLVNYYTRENSNVHRGVHHLSQLATDAYESTRGAVRQFINAAHTHEIIFTRGTTDAINLVASSFGEGLKPGDEVVISAMEHHSNIVPWQLLAARTGAVLRVIPVDDQGEIIYSEYERLLTDHTRLVALVHVSNTLGTVNPVRRMVADAHGLNIPVLLDGAQAVPHQRVDVRALDCDFYCFSGHKMFGPTGTGILYGKEALLDEMSPYQGGGDMIRNVTFQETTFNDLPYKFEAGTPNIAGMIGLGAAVTYLDALGFSAITPYEAELMRYATERLESVEGLRIIGTASQKAGVISFLVDDVHPYDAGTILNHLGIAVRTGHHCTQPLMTQYGIPGTVRASFAFYNTTDEVDALVAGLQKVKTMFA